MRLLKVNYNDFVENQTLKFQMDETATSYDWQNSAMLIDCINQVFYRKINSKNANIEIFFELNGKKYCAGLKHVKDKQNSYLAGEINGNLLLLGYDYKTVIRYLDKEIDGDFLAQLKMSLLDQKLFTEFTNNHNADFFGMVKQAIYESKLEFNTGTINELKQIASIDVDNELISEKRTNVDSLCNELESLSNELDETKKAKQDFVIDLSEIDNLNNQKNELKSEALRLEEIEISPADKEKAQSILRDEIECERILNVIKRLSAEHEEIKESQKEITKKRKANQDNKKEWEKFQEEKKNLNNEVNKLIEKEKQASKSIESIQAKIDATNRIKNQEEKSYIESVKKEQEKTQRELKEKNAALKKEKADKQKINKERAEKQVLLNSKLLELDKELSSEKEKQAQTEKAKKEVLKLFVTQADFDKYYQERASAVEEENRQAIEMFDRKLKQVENEISLINQEILATQEKNKELQAQKEEYAEDLKPQNAYNTTKKYFMQGCTPLEVKDIKNTLKNKIISIDLTVKSNDDLVVNKKVKLGELERGQKELAQAKEQCVLNQTKLAPQEKKDIFEGRTLTENQNQYKNALTRHEGEHFIVEIDNTLTESHKKQADISSMQIDIRKELEELEKAQKTAQIEANKDKTDLTVVEDNSNKEIPPFVFSGQKDIEKLNNEKAELIKNQTAISQELKDAKDKLNKLIVVEFVDMSAEIDKEEARINENKKQLEDKERSLKEDATNKKQSQKDLKWAEKIVNIPIADIEKRKNRKNEINNTLQELDTKIAEKEKENQVKSQTYFTKCDKKIKSLEKDKESTNKKLKVAQKELTETKQKLEEKENATKLLSIKLNELNAVENRKFESNIQAKEYLDKFIQTANKTLRDISENNLGMEFCGNELVINDSNMSKIEWTKLTDTDVLLVYLACLDTAPFVFNENSKWVLIDEDLAVDKKTVDNALNKLKSIQSKFAFGQVDNLPSINQDNENQTDLKVND